MEATTFLKSYSKKVDAYLKEFFSNKKKFGAQIEFLVFDGIERFENYASGGKKLRGVLTILGYQIAGGTKLRAILPVSCGIELLHNFLLIHDDIIDKDDVRRGKPTIHRIYSRKNGEHFGLSKAIVVGDIGAFLGYELIVNSQFSKEKITKALSKLNNLMLMTMYGQMLDIDFDFKKEVTWKEILKVRTYKTAYYTLVMPLTVGAIFAGASYDTLDAIEAYGVPVGTAFQLTDDILGVFGEAEEIGKSNELDIRKGKKTFLFAKALELANSKDKEFLLRWYGSERLEMKKIEKIREIIKKSGSLDYSREVAVKMVEKGKKYVPKITRNPKMQETLYSLADFIIYRNK